MVFYEISERDTTLASALEWDAAYHPGAQPHPFECSAHGYTNIRTILWRLTFHWVIWNLIKSPLNSKEIFPLISEGFDQAHGEHVL